MNIFSRNIKDIEMIDLSLKNAVEIMEELINMNKTINILKIKELLRKSASEQLLMLQNEGQRLNAQNINILINQEMQERQKPKVVSEYGYFEKILIGTKPITNISYSEDAVGKQYIKDLDPQRLHFDYPDLYLNYKCFNLKNNGDGLWNLPDAEKYAGISIRNKRIKYKPKQVFMSDYDKRPLNLLWQYTLKQDMFLKRSFRLWNQIYEESHLQPYYYQGKVLIQNYYRIFCFDILSGQLLWTFSLETKFDRDEYIISMRYNAHPEPSFLMAIGNDILYAEINGLLIGLNIAADFPKKIWQIHLGQYTLSSKPYIINGFLFVSLINMRGELWGILLDKLNGNIIWESFVGVVTKICPASELIIHDGNMLYFVSNRGITVAFHISSGHILWTLEYDMRQYNITDIFIGEGTKEFIRTPFDTSLINMIDTGLLFKPRDSRYIYLCDKANGSIIWKVLLDDNTFLLLNYEDTLFILRGKNVITVDLTSNTESKALTVGEGNLKGIIYNSFQKCLFKVGSVIYCLVPEDNIFRLLSNNSDPDNWLKGNIDEEVFFECRGQNLFCFSNEKYFQKLSTNNLEHLKHEKEYFGKLINDRIDKKEQISTLKLLKKYSQRNIVSVDDYTKLQLQNRNYSNIFYWNLFVDKMCLYNDIYLRIFNFLHLDSKRGFYKDIENNDTPFMPKEKEKILILAEGETLRAVDIKNVPIAFPYFLILKNDQLLCVTKKDGEIVWSKFILGITINEVARVIFNFSLYAALYGNTLVIFDGINLFGVDAHTGYLLWTISNEGEDIGNLFVVHRETVKSPNSNFLCKVVFSDKYVIYFKNGVLYFINPETGYCYSKIIVEYNFIFDMRLNNNFLICFYLPGAKIEFYDYREGKRLKTIDISIALPRELTELKIKNNEVGIIENFKKHIFSLCIKYPYCYFHLSTGLWCFDFDGNYINHKAKEFSEQDNWQTEIFQEQMFSYNPFWKIIAWNDKLINIKFENNISDKSYEETIVDIFQGRPKTTYRTGGFLSEAGWDIALRSSQYLYFADNKIIFFKKKANKYYLTSIDAENGKEEWEVFVTNVYSKLYHISNFVLFNGKILFILSTKPNSRLRSDLTYLYSALLIINIHTGKIIMRKSFPLTLNLLRYMPHIVKVNGVAIINENNMRLTGIRI